METYSINPNPIPQAPTATEQSRRLLNLLVILVVAAIIVCLLYWWTASVKNQPAVTSSAIDQRAQVAAILRNSPVKVTQQQIDSVASQLANSKVTVTDAQKQAVANQLRQVSSQEI